MNAPVRTFARRVIVPPVILLFLAFLTGCAASKLKYTSKNPDPSSPPDGGFAFALHTSTVALTKATAKSDSSTPQSDTSHSSASAGSHTAVNSKVPAPTDQYMATCSAPKPPSPMPAGYMPSIWWRDCLRGLSSSVVAVSDNNAVYVATPDSGLSSKTSVTPKASDSDPLLLTSITFNTTSTIPSAITAVGTGAAAGFVWGPWGAALGGIIGGIGAFAPGITGKAAPSANPGWWDVACDRDTEYKRYARLASDLKDPPNATLAGPLTLDFIPFAGHGSADICWNSLPATTETGGMLSDDLSTEATGWFYRFVPDQEKNGPAHVTVVPPLVANRGADNPALPLAVKLATSYFQTVGSDSTTVGQQSFPVTACRAVDLQITWWQEFDANAKDATHKIQLVTFPLIVADPTYVQVIKAPTHGSITLLPVCGGYASSGAPSTDMADSINNFIKQVQAIKAAQTKWATPAKK
jgi:hypothetical protein